MVSTIVKREEVTSSQQTVVPIVATYIRIAIRLADCRIGANLSWKSQASTCR
jgi:hypothetical protein